jgi:SPOR domain
VPYPIASTFASRFRRPAPDPEASDLERPGGGFRFWSLLPIALAFGLFGAVVWLAYQDTSLAPPVGEPPLIKAAADPFKLPPDETEDTTLSSEEGTVGRLWSDAEQVDQPERLLPTPETPLSPPGVEEPATADATLEQPAGAPAAEASARDVGVAGLPAEPAEPSQPTAAQPASEASLREAEAALDRLLAEVTAMSEDTDAPAAPAPAPAEQQAAIEPPAPPQDEAAAEPAPAPAQDEAAAEPAPAPPQDEAAAEPAPAPAQDEAAAEPAPAPAQDEAAAEPAPAPAQDEAAAEPAPPGAPRDGSPEVAGATVAQAAVRRPPIAPNGDFRIQLAAVRGEADARRAWQMFMGDLGPVLADVEPIFERAETANGVFYRVQVGPFASQDAAEGLCDQLKQRNASCFVIRR